MEHNFAFLKSKWPRLADIAEFSEHFLHTDPTSSMVKIRIFAETLTKEIYLLEGIHGPRHSFPRRLEEIRKRSLLSSESLEHLRRIGREGKIAADVDANIHVQKTVEILELAFYVAKEAAMVFHAIDPGDTEYVIPAENSNFASERRVLEQRIRDNEITLEAELESSRAPNAGERERRRNRALEIIHHIPKTEPETRLIIDHQLRAAGWTADSESLRYSKGVRPEKNRNLAIAEYPFGSGHADYALFLGRKLVGIIEAKRARKDARTALTQAQRYAQQASQKDEYELVINRSSRLKVPFLFAANGRPYLRQFREKSGVWFHDVREPDNHPRPLTSWYTPDGLEQLLLRDTQEANRELEQESFDYLRASEGLSLRAYQVRVIQAVEEAILDGKPSALIVMATGTGKTRTAIGLAYRLLKAERFRRILFLVDRVSLGSQATDNFKDAKIESLQTFTQIYNIDEIEDKKPDMRSRVHFATVQGMVRRLFYGDPDLRPAVDTYDCIIVDEAHRGYFLDKELQEEELLYRNQWEYQSKYRSVIEYFDAFKLALTATPAPHTAEIFGSAVITYSYYEAVLDGYLVDHNLPYSIKTDLSNEGIKWDAGETVEAYDPETHEILKLENIEDELAFEIDQFNDKVRTENFNKAVVKQLAEVLDPEGLEKTLIFATNNAHADLVVDLLKESYPGVDDMAIMKITAEVDKVGEKIKRLKNEKYPNIVVTVDLLTTGVDVPTICNIVFLRRFNSRILYEQMMGRATRLCPEINKDHFDVYDAVGIYEVLKNYSQMQPVVADPATKIGRLIAELDNIPNKNDRDKQIKKIIAKLQRKLKSISRKNEEKFEIKSKGSTVSRFVNEFRAMAPEEQVRFARDNRGLFEFFDQALSPKELIFISEHEDKVRTVEQSYGEGKKPDDYIRSFREFILELDRSNEYVALRTILQRPSALKRKDLKELLLHLEENHYSERALKTAYKEMTDQEMTASIIGLIRQQALGTPILSHSSRVEAAVKKLREENDFNANQLQWLERIGDQLQRELVIDLESFDREPFKTAGGFERMNRRFGNQLESIMERLHIEVYTV